MNEQVFGMKINPNNDMLSFIAYFKNCCDFEGQHYLTFMLDSRNCNDPIQMFIKTTVEEYKTVRKDDDEYYVTFSFNKSMKTSTFGNIYDKYSRTVFNTYIEPDITGVIYLEDNNKCRTVFTNVDHDSYKYKSFKTENVQLTLSVPNALDTLWINGSHVFNILHMEPDVNLYYILISLWKVKPLNIPIFDFTYYSHKYFVYFEKKWDCFITNFDTSYSILEKKIMELPDYLTERSLICTLLYEYLPSEFCSFITNQLQSSTDRLVSYSAKTTRETVIDISDNKFDQVFLFKNHFTRDTCYWIIDEYEEYSKQNGWMTSRHEAYPTTDLPAERVESVFKFIIKSFKTTMKPYLNKSYFSGNDMSYDLRDVFVVKYEMGKQEYLEMHCDDSTITINILLSDPTTDFSGGGTQFEDGLILNPDQGDMIVHGSKRKHSGLQITSGKRYILVFFINIFGKEKI
jgi:hypothetical protein